MTRRPLLVLLVVIWAISWPVTKLGVESVSPLWFACLRFAIATLLLGAMLGARGSLRVPGPADWPMVIVSGALQMAAYSALISVALTKLPAGRASVLAFTTPLWVMPMAVWRRQEEATRRAMVGVGVGLSGIIVIVLPTLLSGGTGRAVPYAMLVGAAVAWAISIVVVRGHHFELEPLVLAPWQTLVATVLLGIAAAIQGGPRLVIDGRGLASLAYVAPVATAFAYWAVVEVGRQMAPSQLAVALLATPALGLAISAVALHEPIDAPLVGGMVLIATGIRLSTRSDAAPARTPVPTHSSITRPQTSRKELARRRA